MQHVLPSCSRHGNVLRTSAGIARIKLSHVQEVVDDDLEDLDDSVRSLRCSSL